MKPQKSNSRTSPKTASRWHGRVDIRFKTTDLIAQQQAALLQPSKGQIVVLWAGGRRLVDQAVDLGVLNAQLDQLTRQRMQVDVH